MNPTVGIPMLAAPFIYGALNDIADNDDRLRAEHYDKYYRARDDYNRQKGQERNFEYNARNQASREEYERRMSIVPKLLTEEDVEKTLAASEARILRNQKDLGAYQRTAAQQKADELLAQSRSKLLTMGRQTQEQINAINARTAATRAAAEARRRSQEQMQGAFSSVLNSSKEALQEQKQAYQQNLAKSQSVMQAAQQIADQRQRLDQQLATQASNTLAMRAAQLAELKARTAPKLPRTGGSRRTQFIKAHRLEDKPYSLKELSKTSSVPLKTLQEVYNRGIGAYKTNPRSVRLKGSFVKGVDAPMSKKLSKEQWAMARVYSFLDGNPKHDNDLR
jgi:hypothetical protein